MENLSAKDTVAFQPQNIMLASENGDRIYPLDYPQAYTRLMGSASSDPRLVEDLSKYLFDIGVSIAPGGRTEGLLVYPAPKAGTSKFRLEFSFIQVGGADQRELRHLLHQGSAPLSPARILDGKATAEAVRRETAEAVARLKAGHGLVPKLTVVLVGDNPASRVYVRNKDRACREVGMESEILSLPASASRDQLLSTIASLNGDARVHGILVQLPLPAGLDAHEAVLALDPSKDVDGLHPESAGRLVAGLPGFVPCTPAGIVEILRRHEIPMRGREAVVVGRSDIVGKPLALLLLREDATVTVCHSKTRDLPAVARRADILVAAIGRPAFVNAAFIRPGAVVIDVGINRCESEADAARFWPGDERRLAEVRAKGSTLVGDVHPADAMAAASAFTPVPGRGRSHDDRDAPAQHAPRRAGERGPAGTGRVSARRPILTVGLTGGIASGKSTVDAIFERLGACVIDADGSCTRCWPPAAGRSLPCSPPSAPPSRARTAAWPGPPSARSSSPIPPRGPASS